jgi:hypothetical protein
MFPEFPSQREFGLGITALAIGCDRRSVACPDRVGRGVRRGGRFCRSASRADSRMRDGRGDDPASRSEHPRTRRNRSTGRSVLRDAGCGVRWAALWHPAVAAGSRGGPLVGGCVTRAGTRLARNRSAGLRPPASAWASSPLMVLILGRYIPPFMYSVKRVAQLLSFARRARWIRCGVERPEA